MLEPSDGKGGNSAFGGGRTMVAGGPALGGSAARAPSARLRATSTAGDVVLMHPFMFFSLRLLPRLRLLFMVPPCQGRHVAGGGLLDVRLSAGIANLDFRQLQTVSSRLLRGRQPQFRHRKPNATGTHGRKH